MNFLKYMANFMVALFLLLSAFVSQGAGLEESDPVAPKKLHIYSPSGEPIPIKIQKASISELQFLLKGSEADDAEERIRNYWEKNPNAYYRWNLTDGQGEIGLITDIKKELYVLEREGSELSEDALPTVVIAKFDGKDRIVGIGSTYLGDVKFHSDFELRSKGYKGIGTVIVADYLSWCLKNNLDAKFDSINSSYSFYEKLGFIYSDPQFTPQNVKDPSVAMFPMILPVNQISNSLKSIMEQDRKRSASPQQRYNTAATCSAVL